MKKRAGSRKGAKKFPKTGSVKPAGSKRKTGAQRALIKAKNTARNLVVLVVLPAKMAASLLSGVVG